MGQAAIPDPVPPEGVRGLVVDPSIETESPLAAASAAAPADNPEDANAPSRKLTTCLAVEQN